MEEAAGMRRLALGFALMMVLTAASAGAQTAASAGVQTETPRFEIAGGYSLLRTSRVTGGGFYLHGGSGSLAVNVNDWLGFVADGGHYRTESIGPSGFGLKITSVMFGPRVSYRGFEHFTVFAQQLIGFGHAGGTLYTLGFASGTAAPGAVNGFAMATGGGLDYNLTSHLAIRAFQGEWLYTAFPNGAANRQNYLRATFGAVFRFGR
jgi:opacity protein-like surface antigen